MVFRERVLLEARARGSRAALCRLCHAACAAAAASSGPSVGLVARRIAATLLARAFLKELFVLLLRKRRVRTVGRRRSSELDARATRGRRAPLALSAPDVSTDLGFLEVGFFFLESGWRLSVRARTRSRVFWKKSHRTRARVRWNDAIRPDRRLETRPSYSRVENDTRIDTAIGRWGPRASSSSSRQVERRKPRLRVAFRKQDADHLSRRRRASRHRENVFSLSDF